MKQIKQLSRSNQDVCTIKKNSKYFTNLTIFLVTWFSGKDNTRCQGVMWGCCCCCCSCVGVLEKEQQEERGWEGGGGEDNRGSTEGGGRLCQEKGFDVLGGLQRGEEATCDSRRGERGGRRWTVGNRCAGRRGQQWPHRSDRLCDGRGKGGQGGFLSPGSDADQDLDQDQTKWAEL